MYDSKTNTIYLQHHAIPGDELGGKKYTFNNINGGFKKLADMGIIGGMFFGNNVDRLGLCLELGLYICASRWNNQVLGFYINDGNELTELGKKVVAQKYANAHISYEPIMSRDMSRDDIDRLNELRKKSIEFGMEVGFVSRASAESLMNAMEAMKSGVNEKAKVEVVATPKLPAAKKTEIKTNIVNAPPTFKV